MLTQFVGNVMFKQPSFALLFFVSVSDMINGKLFPSYRGSKLKHSVFTVKTHTVKSTKLVL